MCLFFERLDKCAIFYASNGEARATSQHMTQVDYHTGFAMHTYHRDAPGISHEEYAKYKYPVPREQVEPREEGSRDVQGCGAPLRAMGCQGWGRNRRLRNRVDN